MIAVTGLLALLLLAVACTPERAPSVIVRTDAPRDPEEARAREPLRLLEAELAPLVASRHPDPLKVVLKRHQLPPFLNFQLTTQHRTSPIYPKEPPKGVTPSEWAALGNSNIDEQSELGTLSLALVDLDGDGQRDLIVSQYMGGTGLFTYVRVYRRSGSEFLGAPATGGEEGDDALYSINGRGGDQGATWVSLGGRILLAYRDGEFDEDRLELLKPFEPPQRGQECLFVHYGYRYSLGANQADSASAQPRSPDLALRRELQAGLHRLEGHPSQDGGGRFGFCPDPRANSDSDSDSDSAAKGSLWPWSGPGHYTFTIVADFPVRVGGNCYAARLTSGNSSYSTRGASISLLLELMRAPDSTADYYNVTGTRSASGLRRGPTPRGYGPNGSAR